MTEYRRPGGGQTDIVELIRDLIEERGTLTYVVVAVVLLGLWLATGIYMVQPGEQGVVRMFGRHIATTDPGLNYHIPRPFQRVDVVNVSSIRRTEIGFRTGAAGDSQRVLEEALMLTRDENIVEVQVLIQYRIKDPAQFLFHVQGPESVLASSAEVALRASVGSMRIDDVITEQRAVVQAETQEFLVRLLDLYETGILVTDVRLQVADAPEQVRDAFHEVVRAREDRERLVNESQAYMEDILPRARGESRQILEDAVAYREERVRRARGDASRFTQILAEYQQAPEVTRERMHIEALEEILARTDKVLLTSGVDSGVLPFLPLRNMPNVAQAQPAASASTTPQLSPDEMVGFLARNAEDERLRELLQGYLQNPRSE